MKMLLEVEKRSPVQAESFAKIEQSLRSLKSYGPESFAILTAQDGSYLQVAGGRITCNQRSFSLQSLSQQPSSIGYES